ncbi:MAG: hypothetical protein U9N84_12580, partial [Actinomycetota bacterium]|nr:hypothetical protein [Actinomycetota bacterium]
RDPHNACPNSIFAYRGSDSPDIVSSQRLRSSAELRRARSRGSSSDPRPPLQLKVHAGISDEGSDVAESKFHTVSRLDRISAEITTS